MSRTGEIHLSVIKRLDRTETALEIMGKARALLEDISESADLETKRKKR